jgi:cytochrome P450
MTQQRFDVTGWAAEDIANPYPVYRRYRENDPVHLCSGNTGEPDTWYVFRYDDVRRVLSNQHFGRGGSAPVPPGYGTLRRIVGNWLVFLDPPRHGELRSLLNKEFSSQVVTALRARIEEIAHDLLTGMKEKAQVDLVDDFAAPLPILVISELLGVPTNHRSWLRERAMSLQEASSGRASRQPDSYSRAETAAQELAGYFQQEAPHRFGESLTDDEVVATCIHLLTAGHETTTNLIGKSVIALLKNPGALDELRTNPELMPNAVDEFIRYDSPVQMVTRWAYQHEMLRGRDIHRGDKVVLVLGSANRDPLRFPEPDALRLRRPSSRHCGFGIGIHYCLGAALARVEAEIGLTMLLEHLPQFRLTGKSVQYAEDLVFHGPKHLVLRRNDE